MASDIFSNSNFIYIPSSGSASSYPSTINVSGVAGNIQKVTVTLLNVNHTYPDEIDVLLVGPQGQRSILMSDAGGFSDLNGVSIIFDQDAVSPPSDNGGINSGALRTC